MQLQDKLAAAKECSPQLYDDLYWKKACEREDRFERKILFYQVIFNFIAFNTSSYLFGSSSKQD
uniref:Uncharacterized protein n=1 Tax=Oryza meridionalis TaxID=40149 RepID=A0A0E0E7B8_9ORYZ